MLWKAKKMRKIIKSVFNRPFQHYNKTEISFDYKWSLTSYNQFQFKIIVRSRHLSCLRRQSLLLPPRKVSCEHILIFHKIVRLNGCIFMDFKIIFVTFTKFFCWIWYKWYKIHIWIVYMNVLIKKIDLNKQNCLLKKK